MKKFILSIALCGAMFAENNSSLVTDNNMSIVSGIDQQMELKITGEKLKEAFLMGASELYQEGNISLETETTYSKDGVNFQIFKPFINLDGEKYAISPVIMAFSDSFYFNNVTDIFGNDVIGGLTELNIEKTLKEILKDTKDYIELNSDKSNEMSVIIDVNCPACKKFLKNLVEDKETFKDSKIKIYFTTLLSAKNGKVFPIQDEKAVNDACYVFNEVSKVDGFENKINKIIDLSSNLRLVDTSSSKCSDLKSSDKKLLIFGINRVPYVFE